MQFDFKFKSKKTAISKAQFAGAAGVFWQKIRKAVFFVFLIGMVALGGYVWQKNLSAGGWSDEKKQEYLNAQNKGVIFNEGAFNKAILDVESRRQKNVISRQQIKDIFKAY